ncbi:hypothetical protein [Clostridium sp. Marseille-QA1073]
MKNVKSANNQRQKNQRNKSKANPKRKYNKKGNSKGKATPITVGSMGTTFYIIDKFDKLPNNMPLTFLLLALILVCGFCYMFKN